MLASACSCQTQLKWCENSVLLLCKILIECVGYAAGPLLYRMSKEPMSDLPICPVCNTENTYPDRENYVCADCDHEWPAIVAEIRLESDDRVVKDGNGNVLSDGDAVVLIKDLKVKGSSITLKMGSKVKSIRLVDGDHEVDCKMDVGSFMLKACYLKKV